MKKTLSCLILLTFGLFAAGAQETTTTVQVAPSDQVKYPDASEVLNKTEPKVEKKAPALAAPAPAEVPQIGLPSAKPLVAATLLPAKPVMKPVAKPVVPVAKPTHGWFLRWVVSASNEQAARAWAQDSGWEVQVQPAGEGLWEVISGPLESVELKQSLTPLAGEATLVKR